MQKLYDMSTLQEFVVHKFSQGACKKDVNQSLQIFEQKGNCRIQLFPLQEHPDKRIPTCYMISQTGHKWILSSSSSNTLAKTSSMQDSWGHHKM
jgi:hypothetical protein